MFPIPSCGGSFGTTRDFAINAKQGSPVVRVLRSPPNSRSAPGGTFLRIASNRALVCFTREVAFFECRWTLTAHRSRSPGRRIRAHANSRLSRTGSSQWPEAEIGCRLMIPFGMPFVSSRMKWKSLPKVAFTHCRAGMLVLNSWISTRSGARAFRIRAPAPSGLE